MKSVINAVYSERIMILSIIGSGVFIAALLSLLTLRYSYRKAKASVFTLLYPLDSAQLIGLSASLVKLVLIVTGVILANRITLGSLLGFYLSDLLVLITLKMVKPFILDTFSSTMCFVAIYLEGQLFDYYLSSGKELYLVIIVLGLSVFITLYGVYQLVEMYSRILTTIRKKSL